MASVTYSSGTVIPVAWLNDVNALVYGKATSTGNPIQVSLAGNVTIAAPSSGVGIVLNTGTGSSTYREGLRLEGAGVSPGDVSPAVSFSGSNVNAAIWSSRYSSMGGDLVFGTQLAAGGIPTEKMRISEAGNVTIAAPTSGTALTVVGNVAVTGTAGTLGYGTGAGGSVTQATSKATSVTLNKASGTIIMNNAALASGASVSFVCNNSLYNNNGDTITYILSGATSGTGNYQVYILGGASGSFTIKLTNITGGSLSDNININFNIIKGSIT